MIKISSTGMILIICVKLERDSHSRMNALSRSKHRIIRTLNIYTEGFLRHLTKIFSVQVFMNTFMFHANLMSEILTRFLISQKCFLHPKRNSRNHEAVVEKVMSGF